MVLETERLIHRKFSPDGDAAFILQLLNEPSFLKNIGDRKVRTLEDARNYLLKGPVASYEQFGFGFYLVELKETGLPIGMSGLIKRPSLPDADIGFAFLPAHWAKGYAGESAAAILAYGRQEFGLDPILGIVSPDNHGSIRVLEKIGLKYKGMVTMPGETVAIKLFSTRVESAPEPA